MALCPLIRWSYTWRCCRVSPSPRAERVRARSDAEAKHRLLEFLNGSLACVCTTATWFVLPVGDSWRATTSPTVIRLWDSQHEDALYLRSTIEYAYVDDPKHAGERKVSTLGYAHTVGTDPDMATEMYSWEWQDGASPYPHLHLGRGKLHLPTGRVFFEHVLLFLIMDLGREARDGWEGVLGDHLGRLARHETWGNSIEPA